MLCMLWSLSVLIHFLFLSWSMLNKFFVFIRLSTWRLFVAVVSQLNLRLFIVQGH